MFNFATICESVKRHWIVIAIVTVLALAAGVVSSLNSDDPDEAPTKHVAEASLYLTGYGYDQKDSGEYNYSFSEGYMVTDSRRLVVSSEVAGAVRAKYGKDVTITVPTWMNDEKKSEYSTRFLYIDVAANDEETALAACEMTVELARQAIERTLPVESVTLAEPVAVKTGSADRAANWGIDALPGEESTPIVAASGISMKKLVIFGFIGAFLSIFGFAAFDILTRRVRSEGDVERLLDLPVLATASSNEDMARLAKSIRVLMGRSELSSLVVAGASAADGAKNVERALVGADEVSVTGLVDLSGDVDAASRVLGADSVLLVIAENASSSKQLECALKQLSIAGVPVLGVVFVPKKARKASRAH